MKRVLYAKVDLSCIISFPHRKPILIKDSESMTLQSFCGEPCKKKMSCGRHMCRKKCQPPHAHRPCMERVQFQHVVCGHMDTKRCEEDEMHKRCEQAVGFNFPACGHPG